MKPWSPLLMAVTLLTRLPLPQAIPTGAEKDLPELERRVRQSVGWFPLVGLLLGAMAWGALALADAALPNPVPSRLAAAGVLVLWAVVTGAFHWDGFADTVDAWGVCRSGKERMLEVMKDPRAGSFAVVAICLAILAQWECLSELIATRNWRLVAMAPVVSRWSMSLSCAFGRPARDSGLGRVYLGRPRLANLALATALCGAISGWLHPAPGGILALAAAAGGAALVLWWSYRHLGGQTGDVLGFACVACETMTLILLALLAA